MSRVTFPEMIESLPDIDLDRPGVRGKLLQAGDKQVVFFDLEPIGTIPPHRHRAQWGFVLEGELELSLGGEAQTLKAGQAYFIPAGVEHSVTVRVPSKVVDFFDEPERYQPRP